MGIVSAFQLPHPPIMVEEVGGIETKKVKKSIEAANRVGREIKELAPETIVIISSHGPVFTDAICIYDYPLKGYLSSFNAPEVELSFAADEDLKKDILKRSEKYDIPVVRSGEINITRYGFREELDHGVMVPMYFINKFTSNFKLLPIAFGMLPYEDLYSFGKLIKESAEALNKRLL